VVDQNQLVKQITNTPSTTIIDVHGAYPWTLSPVMARASTPVIEVTEYKQVLSSELMGYAYSLAGTVDNFRVAARTLPTATAAVAAVAKQAAATLSFLPGAGIAGGVANFIGNSVINTGFVAGTEKLQQLNKPAKEASAQDSTKNDPNNVLLDPYRGLYAVEPTGFVYRLPYASSENFVQNNTWGTPGNEIAKAVGGVLEMLVGDTASGEGTTGSGGGAGTGGGAEQGKSTIRPGNIAGSLADIAKGVMTSTGGVINAETPKSYKGPQTNDSVTVKFILYNTINFSDIKRNWELCYLLSYQNLPNRKGINLMDPPKLYRVLIPGYRQFPICWVSNLRIRNLGAVRMVDIDNPNNIIVSVDLNAATYSPSIKMIPEAYEIEVTFEHAFFSAQNLFAYALQPSSVVTTTVSLTETLRGSTPPTG
jgi:hypothetical protein